MTQIATSPAAAPANNQIDFLGNKVDLSQVPPHGQVVQPPQGFPQIAGVTWTCQHVKSKGDDDKQKVVAAILEPTFDEKNPQAGMQQISQFPWADDNFSGGAGYASWPDAVVKLVNTQFGTNLRNRARQANSGRVNAEQVQVEALNRATASGELQASIQQGGNAMNLCIEKWKKIVRDEIKAKGGTTEAPAEVATAGTVPGVTA